MITRIKVEPSQFFKSTERIAAYLNVRFQNKVKRQLMKGQDAFPDKKGNELRVKKERFEDGDVYVCESRYNPDAKKAVLFVHGGGGILPPTDYHYDFAIKLAQSLSCPVHFARYPLVPQANAVQSLSWLETYYQNMESRYEQLYIVADSAGANLACALCRQPREKVKGVVLISPAAGLDRRKEKLAPFEKRDIVLEMRFLDDMAAQWGKEMELTDFAINPLYVDYHHFPETLLFYGKHEMFYGVMADLLEKMKESPNDITCYEGQIHCHDWVLAQMFEESRQALKQIVAFIERT
ncbi:MAG: alpha/beta hydrolase [Erysipelotrichaceae bacterium]|nr:alpha/beta hydrolase [Erysipelotrichaceae bacterium]